MVLAYAFPIPKVLTSMAALASSIALRAIGDISTGTNTSSTGLYSIPARDLSSMCTASPCSILSTSISSTPSMTTSLPSIYANVTSSSVSRQSNTVIPVNQTSSLGFFISGIESYDCTRRITVSVTETISVNTNRTIASATSISAASLPTSSDPAWTNVTSLTITAANVTSIASNLSSEPSGTLIPTLSSDSAVGWVTSDRVVPPVTPSTVAIPLQSTAAMSAATVIPGPAAAISSNKGSAVTPQGLSTPLFDASGSPFLSRSARSCPSGPPPTSNPANSSILITTPLSSTQVLSTPSSQPMIRSNSSFTSVPIAVSILESLMSVESSRYWNSSTLSITAYNVTSILSSVLTTQTTSVTATTIQSQPSVTVSPGVFHAEGIPPPKYPKPQIQGTASSSISDPPDTRGEWHKVLTGRMENRATRAIG